jgi:hypothetical protein|tara:strand:- start:303 stop:482 length:180 start_codon:yes stop_codon:yes gene_type:complete
MKVEFTLDYVKGFECGLFTAKEVTESKPTIKLTIDPNDPEYDKLLEFIQAAQNRRISGR